ncbi:MAG TPA: MFS transporter [Polyangiaceae bacterium]|nr:MFS transporter [Polyangiaceae bacterium]
MLTRRSARPSPSLALEPPSTGASSSSSAAESEALFTPPFVLLLCVYFCFALSYSTFFLLPKYLTREFQASAGLVGAIAALGLLAGVAATPLIGALIDRGVRRPSITYGALVHGLSACAFATLHTISAPLYLLRLITGVSYALVFNAVVTLTADLAPPKKLGQALGLCGAAGMAANAIAPAIAEEIADLRGWGLVFLLAGGSALFSALLSLGIREPRAVARTAAQADVEVTPSAWSLARDPERAGAFVCSAAAGAAFGALFTFTQPFALSLGANKVSSFFVGYTLCALSVRVVLGGLADRLGRHRVAFGALVLYGLVACMTTALRPELLFAVGACLGLAHGFLYPSLNALAAEGVPRARRGAIMSYFSACFYGGFALWAIGAGALAKAVGYPPVFLVSALLVWSSLLFLPRNPRSLRA